MTWLAFLPRERFHRAALSTLTVEVRLRRNFTGLPFRGLLAAPQIRAKQFRSFFMPDSNTVLL
jgi:hypothetical protein